VWHVELFVCRNARKEVRIRPGPSEFVQNTHQEFLRLVDGLRPAGPAQQQERLQFGMSEGTWNDFLRRLGFDPDAGNEQQHDGA
jgi:hypothetical protein